jgi:hypothetical protein
MSRLHWMLFLVLFIDLAAKSASAVVIHAKSGYPADLH